MDSDGFGMPDALEQARWMGPKLVFFPLFNLSVAAKAQNLLDKDIKALNKRLKWQTENLNCGLRYVTVNLIEAKLTVFVDSSFANNKDLSLQLGFVLTLVNKSTNANNFTI